MHCLLTFEQKTDDGTQPAKSTGRTTNRKRKTAGEHRAEGSLKVEVLEDGQCLVVSVQMKCSRERRDKLYDWIKTQARPPDVIAIQDPPLELAWKLPPNYGRWCRGDDGTGKTVPLTEEDCPTYIPYYPPYLKARDKQAIAEAEKRRDERVEAAKQLMQGLSEEEGTEEELERKKLAKVAFLVHNSLTWEPSEPEDGPNRGIVASVRIPLKHGSLSIHNFYNHNNRLDVVELMALCRDEGDVHVCAGDGNMKHERWGGPKVKRHDPEAETLVREMDAIPMVCKNERGKHTYGRSKRTKDTWISTLDLFLVSSALANQSVWNMLEVKGYESDHAVTSLSIDMDLSRKIALRFMWDETNQAEYEEFVKKCTKRRIALPAQADLTSLARITDTLIEILNEANENIVPVRRVFEHNPFEKTSTPTTPKQKRQNWRGAAERMSEASRSIHNLAKRAGSWGMPRPMTHTPAFEVGSTIIKDNDGKVKSYVNTIWSLTAWKGGPRKSPFDTGYEKDVRASKLLLLYLPSATNTLVDKSRPWQHTRYIALSYFVYIETNISVAVPGSPERDSFLPAIAQRRRGNGSLEECPETQSLWDGWHCVRGLEDV
ncbi:hypothetical protein J4E83_007224 [Alternaria metachromatica]|uniref:uncharacterized protein n=1 Tax=Alternaria metachromatica TaxID=283354 RepID=UPI0020C44E30|nr:uncharacterized protein J4E83_007224 [Alternaria metachromatica]KAI4614570.1 hypothetical protein J4E83_007224 [Alternaria metachromatica]